MGNIPLEYYCSCCFILIGIQKHIIATGGWVSILSYVQHKRNEYLAEKDAVYRHYIELHPDDFPVPGMYDI